MRGHTSAPRVVKPSGYDPRYVFTDEYTRTTNPSTARWVLHMRRVEALGLVYTERSWMQKWLWWQNGFQQFQLHFEWFSHRREANIFNKSWIGASFHLMWTKPCYILVSLRLRVQNRRKKWNFPLNFRTMRKLSDLYSGIFQTQSSGCASGVNYFRNFTKLKNLNF